MYREVKILDEFTEEKIKSLSISDLVSRMDQVRLCAHEERWSHLPPEYRYQPHLVSHLMGTELVLGKNEETRRDLAYCAFRYLLQMDLDLSASGISNLVSSVYMEDQWTSPLYWINSAVLNQYKIIASRIALECFINLIYVAHFNKEMDGDSKFRGFKTWISQSDSTNPYIYFIPHIISALKFTRDYRDKEIHGSSRFARSLLRLGKPTSHEQDIQHQLSRTLSQIWPPLLEILNGRKPNSIGGFDSSCEEFAWKYLDSIGDDKSDKDKKEFHKYAIEFFLLNYKLITDRKSKK